MFNYSEAILDHFYHPLNVGEFANNEDFISSIMSTPDKTATMQLQVSLENKSSKQERIIMAVKFKTFGCPCCIAVTSLITSLIENKPVEKIVEISSEYLIKSLELPKEKYYCALLGEDLLKALYQKIMIPALEG